MAYIILYPIYLLKFDTKESDFFLFYGGVPLYIFHKGEYYGYKGVSMVCKN